jgi:primosomal protein N' (replication factor Y) (superfamily II helicase)
MEQNKPNFILDIIPLTKIPLSRDQFFCYLSDEKLPAGTLVSIPLFKRKVEGIVIRNRLDFKRFGNIELKKIEKVIEKEFLTPIQLKLAQFISDYYISSLGVVMKNFVPKRTKARSRRHETYNAKQKRVTLTKEQLAAVEKITNWKPVSPAGELGFGNFKFLLFGPSASGKTEVYIHSILELEKKDKDLQFLILLPEKTLTPQAIERYRGYFNHEEIVVLSSNIPKGQFFANWQQIKSGKAKIIIGTRMAVFAPIQKLGLIVIDEEQDMSYKQWDMNPRYDARTVAEKLSEIHVCPIVFGSSTPSVETYHKAIINTYKLLKLPILDIRNTSYISSQQIEKIQDAIIVDMRKERLDKNLSCISKKLKSEIAYALKNRLQIILFINRQGMSNFSVCESCKAILNCPKCDRALIYDNSGNYKCIHCSYRTTIIPSCSSCKGIAFKNIGLGTQKVEREIANLFPDARIARIDSQAIKKASFQEKIYADFSNGKIDILIGTQMISKGWDLPKVSLVGIIDADNLLSFPDFSTDFKAFQTIVQLSGRVNRPGAKFPGVVVIQTYQPENKLVKMAAERNWEKFFGLEITERKSLSLPPFSKLIKLVYQDYNFKKMEAEANLVYNSLKKTKNINLSESQDAYVPKIRGRFRKQIVIKYKKEISPQLRKVLNSLGQGWIVDVDPINIT